MTAIDVSPTAVEWTQHRHPGIDAAVVDVENDDVPGEYDVVLCMEVLQQVRHPVAVLRKLATALQEGGEMIVSLPNEFHLARRLAILLGHVDFGGIEDTHIKLFTPVEHRHLFAACGLTVTDARAQSIIPPRWWGGRLHQATNRLANRWPGMFALSVVYRVVPQGTAEGQGA